MKNEDSRGVTRLYNGRNFVPNVQDNLTMKKTPQQVKITGKQEKRSSTKGQRKTIKKDDRKRKCNRKEKRLETVMDRNNISHEGEGA